MPLPDCAISELGTPRKAGLVFPSPNTGDVQAGVKWMVDEIAKDAGVGKITFHTFRRTHTSILANHRCEIHTAPPESAVRQELLGHVHETVADQHYTDVWEETLRHAVAVFDEIWRDFGNKRRVFTVLKGGASR